MRCAMHAVGLVLVLLLVLPASGHARPHCKARCAYRLRRCGRAHEPKRCHGRLMERCDAVCPLWTTTTTTPQEIEPESTTTTTVRHVPRLPLTTSTSSSSSSTSSSTITTIATTTVPYYP